MVGVLRPREDWHPGVLPPQGDDRAVCLPDVVDGENDSLGVTDVEGSADLGAGHVAIENGEATVARLDGLDGRDLPRSRKALESGG